MLFINFDFLALKTILIYFAAAFKAIDENVIPYKAISHALTRSGSRSKGQTQVKPRV